MSGKTHRSSGDLLADRRFAWATALLDEGDCVGAADLLDQVVAMAPLWAPAWSTLGDARERLDDRAAALTAWRRAEALDPEESLGAGLKIARLEGATPAALPSGYMKALFDDYAPRFDHHLVDGLRYRGPDLLNAAMAEAAPGRMFERGLDLGCGTGLMGRMLASRVSRIDGIDLSPAMVAMARKTGLYHTLSVASIDEALAATPEQTYALVTAADVFVYVGDLAPVFLEINRVLAPGGILAATLQILPQSDVWPPPGYALGADLRFAHAPDYVEDTLSDAGFELISLKAASTRMEKGIAVPGLLLMARRPPGA